MSELKAVHAFDVYEAYTKTGDDDAAQVYIKSEADKAIAELKEENEKLKATPEQIMKEVFDKCLIYPKEMVRLDDAYKLAVSLRKQKYKRCLAMAKYCEAMRGHYLSYEEPKWFWYREWSARWLELAEKFKEGV